MTLRSKLIRLAHDHPEHREKLLPLVTAAGQVMVWKGTPQDAMQGAAAFSRLVKRQPEVLKARQGRTSKFGRTVLFWVRAEDENAGIPDIRKGTKVTDDVLRKLGFHPDGYSGTVDKSWGTDKLKAYMDYDFNARGPREYRVEITARFEWEREKA